MHNDGTESPNWCMRCLIHPAHCRAYISFTAGPALFSSGPPEAVSLIKLIQMGHCNCAGHVQMQGAVLHTISHGYHSATLSFLFKAPSNMVTGNCVSVLIFHLHCTATSGWDASVALSRKLFTQHCISCIDSDCADMGNRFTNYAI